MTNSASTKRNISGILLLDKSSGFSSNSALQKVKRLFRAKKAGHTGSLDPLASGMLPICFGEATKFSQFLLESDKAYRVSALLGIRTATSDKEGEVIAERPVPALTKEQINQELDAFRGTIQQIPSMFSALKHQGQPLYKLARQGITVDRPSREITVYELQLNDYKDHVVEFNIICSKGTYVRTLVDDLGEALGCGAHVTSLRRLFVGPYPPESMITMDSLELERDQLSNLDKYLLPLETCVSHLPKVQITESMAFYIRQGQSVMVNNVPASGMVQIATKSGQFIGVGEIIDINRLAPRRLISSKS